MHPTLALATLFLSIIAVGGTLVAAYDALERRLRRPIGQGPRAVSRRAGPLRARAAVFGARARRARPHHGSAVARVVPRSRANGSIGR